MSVQNISIRMINVPRISNITLSKPTRWCLYSRCLSLIFLFLTEFLCVFVCFLKRSHILACGHAEGLCKRCECIKAKMISSSSLHCLDVAASLCRPVPSHYTEGPLQSCNLCWLWWRFEAKKAWRSHREYAFLFWPGVTVPIIATPTCRAPSLLVLKICSSKSEWAGFNFSFFLSLKPVM